MDTGRILYERARVNSSRPGDDQPNFSWPGHKSGVDIPAAWYMSAVARLRAGRIDQYRVQCRDMTRRFGSSFANSAEKVARACLMCADDPDVVAAAALLAERAVKDIPRDTYAQYTAGLADFRSGAYKSAIKRMRASREVLNETYQRSIYRDAYLALTGLVKAMAMARQGQADTAREALAKAEGVMAGPFPAEGPGDLYPDPWQEWAHCEIIRHEARSVVRWDSIFPADPFAR